MKRFLALIVLLLIAMFGLAAVIPERLAWAETAAPASVQVVSSTVQVPARMARRWPENTPASSFPDLAAIPEEAVVPPPRLYFVVEGGREQARLARLLTVDLSRSGYDVVFLPPDRPVASDEGAVADLYIGHNPPNGFSTLPLTPTRFVPVVSFWSPVTEVTYADLETIFYGGAETWADLGYPSAESIVPLALRTIPPAPLPSAGPTLPDVNALVATLEQTPGGIALIPRRQVEVRLRVLQVDGHDPLLEQEVVLGDPLVRHLVLSWSPTVAEDVSERVRVLAQQQRVVSPEAAIEVVVVGDVMPGRGVERTILARDGDYARPFVKIAETLRQADLTIANLEGVLSNEIPPPQDAHTFYFVASGRFTEGLRLAGVDAVSLANNHSMNFGSAGMSDTLALLEAAGIATFGGGMNLEHARQPVIFEVKGVRFAFLGYDGISHELYGAEAERAGTAPAYFDIISEDIAAIREEVDVVIPYFHWGWEYTSEPSPWQEQLAHSAVESGADVVLGNHPHWVQGIERYQGATILYSLGNFVFDQMWSLETRLGVIARLVFWGDRLVGLRFQAIRIEDAHQPHLLPVAEADKVYQKMKSVSPKWLNPAEGAEP